MATAAQLAQRRLFVAAARKRHTPRALPRPQPPTGPTRSLTAPLLAVADDLDAAVSAALADVGLPAPRLDAADGDGALPPYNRTELLARMRRLVADVVRRRGGLLDTSLAKVAAQVSSLTKAQFARETKAAMGVDLSEAEPALSPLIDRFRRQHTDLIKLMARDKVERVRALLAEAGPATRVETIRDRLMAEQGVGRRQAALIARDQVLKLNSAVTEARHTAAGIEEYVWRTSGDERVREEHRALDGTRHKYSDPPVQNRKGERANPGQFFQCRCTMEPVIPGVEITPAPSRPAPSAPAPRPTAPDEPDAGPVTLSPRDFGRGRAIPKRPR